MNDTLTRYLRSRCGIVYALKNLTVATWTQLLPADPDRFDLWISSDASVGVGVSFGLGGTMHTMINLSTSYNFVEFNEDTVGELIKLPVFAIANSGTPVAFATAMSYTQESKRIHERIIKRLLSDAGAL